jgi:mono/diheme cytochrome c family protein
MPNGLRIATCSSAALVIALAACAPNNRPVELPANAVTVNEGFKLDNNMAVQGEVLFRSRGCGGCHAIGRHLAGPDLYNVVNNRPLDWLQSFIIDAPRMIETDPVAQALYKQNHNAKMPRTGASQSEALAIVHYLAAESERVRQAQHRESE